jgi:hypothetical protein
MYLPRRITFFALTGALVGIASIVACGDDTTDSPAGTDAGIDSNRPDTSTPDKDSSVLPDAGQQDTGTDTGPACGNGTIQAGEACDLGTAMNTGVYGGCKADCTTAAYCGDTIVNGPGVGDAGGDAGDAGPEKCDLGTAMNTGAYGGCNANCTKAAYCGDGIVNGPANAETCDRGALNGALNACTTTCTDTKLLLWLDAADPNGDGVLPADNTPLAAWVDKARARAVVQATAAQQPKWRSVGINGKPSFELDGTDDLFDVDLDINGALRPDLTVVVVFQNFAGDTSLFSGVWGQDNGGWDRFMGTGGSSGLNGISNGSGFTAVTNLTTEGVPRVVTTTLRGDTANMSTVHVNGVLGATFTGSVQPGETHMSIGNINGPALWASTHAFDGYIAEVRIYDEALSDANRMALETALIAKYVP